MNQLEEEAIGGEVAITGDSFHDRFIGGRIFIEMIMAHTKEIVVFS